MKPSKSEKPKLHEGLYVRLKDGNVYQIHKMSARMTREGNRRSYIDRRGNMHSYTEKIPYDTFYVTERDESSNKYKNEWFIVEEDEVIGVYSRLIDCLKKGDWVYADKDLNGISQVYCVDERIKNKHYDYVVCKGYNGNVYILYNENLISVKNALPRSFRFQNVKIGSVIRHVRQGWLTVVSEPLGSGKVIVQSKAGIRCYPRGEFLEVKDDEE